jgi:hypothetical protein
VVFYFFCERGNWGRGSGEQCTLVFARHLDWVFVGRLVGMGREYAGSAVPLFVVLSLTPPEAPVVTVMSIASVH